ncbi:hypothetical protein BOTCAL_0388g00060 [Botryotinia calthae]|uniref:Uncharacterized protein n=1 Tax=Botryotinia calthae TaxID=38488 RepID=A0A4Y8CQZ7_9HELO|nr:hypothetical protein BOTCAL_0388g00060 [Botryotinia calthae]
MSILAKKPREDMSIRGPNGGGHTQQSATDLLWQVLEDFRLILNVRTESYEQITADNIQAVMRELQSCRERRMVFPVYLKLHPSVETSSDRIVSVEE